MTQMQVKTHVKIISRDEDSNTKEVSWRIELADPALPDRPIDIYVTLRPDGTITTADLPSGM
ncbi:MAG: hypothetical protein M3R61_00765 [Chloroflexota bacterium]|nr:hypothetical protein [Chloroflexota bacterium]